ncbi:MAG: hypothetical protein AB2693_20615 [Candidatus Thiodiazotropha sp.]
MPLYEDGTSFTATSSLLNQTRDVLYLQNQLNVQPSQNMANIPQPQHVLPNDNIQANRLSEHSGHYTTDLPRSQVDAQQCQQRLVTMNTTNSMNERSNSNSGSSNRIENDSAPPWVSQMLQGLDSRLRQIESHLAHQNTGWQNMGLTLKSQSERMTNIEQQMSELNGLKQNMVRLQITVDHLDGEVERANRKVQEYDSTIQTYSDMCDDMRIDKRMSDSLIEELRVQVEQLQTEQNQLKSKVSNCDSAIVDLQCRSMRDNLIFTGIDEPDFVPNEPEDTESTLCNFLQHEMNIDERIAFHRVHRIGKFERENDAPRPIVAKFERFKDREFVRTTAPKTLKGKRFGVREQFPKVVEDQRKLLYPEMKRARANEQNKVRLVRDKLFINNVEFVPPKDTYQQKRGHVRYEHQFNYSGQTHGRQRRNNFTSSNSSAQRPNADSSKHTYASRVFQRSSNTSVKFTPTNNDFTVQTRNRFERLSNLDDNPVKCSDTRKKKASSPLETNLTFKKHCEHLNSDSESNSESSVIEVIMSPQCDPPAQGRLIPQSPQQSIERPHT